MNWKLASDLTGIKPDAAYITKGSSGKIASQVYSGDDLTAGINCGVDIAAYMEITIGDYVDQKQKRIEVLCSSNNRQMQQIIRLRAENERLQSQSRVDWKPLAEITEWPVVGENQTIVTTKNGWICWVDDATLDFIKNTDGHTHYAIVNLPAPERNLKACWYCKSTEIRIIQLKCGDKYQAVCAKCRAAGPEATTEQGAREGWGWE